VITEKIVQLPDCHQASNGRPELVSELPSREAVGLPETGFVFCCFAEAFKIARPVFDVWMRLLSRNEGSVLWLSPGSDAVDRLRREAAARGIDPARLVFAAPVPPAEHLSRHRLADVFLDTLPFNTAVAGDALWAGVPVVTCKGNAFAARIGASLATATGQSDLIAADLTGYEALALRLAAESERLAECKRRLADGRAIAPLFDLDRFRRHVEEAYTNMCELLRSGTPPHSFAVTVE
jgi:predicted O-linked N-acetylglucosamine transferase (SPINDLY family)